MGREKVRHGVVIMRMQCGTDTAIKTVAIIRERNCQSTSRHLIIIERDNGYDNRVAGLDSPSQNRENPPLRFIVLLSRGRCFASADDTEIGSIVQVPTCVLVSYKVIVRSQYCIPLVNKTKERFEGEAFAVDILWEKCDLKTMFASLAVVVQENLKVWDQVRATLVDNVDKAVDSCERIIGR